MSLRRLIPTLVVLAATAVPTAGAVAADNKVTAVNETDGAQIFQLSIDLQRITEGPVLDQNIAQVYASCEDCRTIAVAVQVLLLMDDIRQVVPVNLAESINYECTSCESLAYAGQLVLSTGGKVRLTGDARRRIAEIEEALNALSTSGASLFEIYAEIDRLVDDLKQTVVDGLVPVGNRRDAQAPRDAGGVPDADVVTGSGTEADTGSAPDGELPLVIGDDGAAAEAPIEGSGDPATAEPTAPAEPSPTTTTGDPAPTPGVTTPTTTSAGTAPSGSTTAAPAPTEPTGSSTPTVTETTTTSEPAPTTSTETTAEPAPAETTTTTTEPASEPSVP